MSLADHADNRRQTPNYINYINRKLKSLRNNAALLHSSAGSALSAGEYSHKSTQFSAQRNPNKSPADLADLRRQNPKPH